MASKKIKKVLIGIFSVFSINFIIYLSLIFSPGLLYANTTQIDFVTIYHDQTLDSNTEQVVRDAIRIIKKSKEYDETVAIDLCLNDGSFYPKLLGGIMGGTAFAFYDKAIVNYSEAKFNENIAEFKWAINNYEVRQFNLTWLLAHEFTHNLQNHSNYRYVVKSTMGQINWKLEGHAEYVAREFQNDDQLKNKIDFLIARSAEDHVGIPVFKLADGTIQNLAYYKYALIVQYLMEEENKVLEEIYQDKRTLDQAYEAMINWKNKK